MTTVVIVTATKLTTRKMRIILERMYMACNLAIIMTCIIHRQVSVSEVLLQLNNSPPSIAFTTIDVHNSTLPEIVPENPSH
jgi:hypothetical protein